jgi:hypothetical protein
VRAPQRWHRSVRHLPGIPARLTSSANSRFSPMVFIALALFLVAGNCPNQPPGPSPSPRYTLPATKPSFLSRKGLGNDPTKDTKDYYDSISALNRVPTLADFRTRNGFGFPPGNEVVAYYFNAGDLGLGREMHCTSNLPVVFRVLVACYVTNYGDPAGDPDVALPLVEQHDPTKQFATVAMEYSLDTFPVSPPNPPRVTFYVYAPKQNGEPSCQNPAVNACLLLAGAKLDSQGEKRVPEMCMGCHGGNLNRSPGADATVTGSSFLPFDVYSFKFSGMPGFTLADQQEAFRQLNSIVEKTRAGCPSAVPGHPDAICDLIDGMYPGGVNTAGSTSVDTYVPSGWVNTPFGNHTTYYNVVIKAYCRTCHVAQRTDIDWISFDQFRNALGRVYPPVCQTKDMPHAEVPWTNFWLSDPVHAPGFFEDSLFNGLTFPSPGTCTP